MAASKSLADGLRKSLPAPVKVYAGDNREKARKPDPRPSESFAEAYTALRRRIEPLFELHPSGLTYLASAENALRAAKVPRRHWSGYLAWAFEEFAGMTRGKLSFAPVDRLAAHAMIDRYKATLPVQKLDTKKARAMLRARGYDGPVSAAVEYAQALHDGRTPPVFKGEGAEAAHEAGRWLAERLDEVGMVEVGT